MSLLAENSLAESVGLNAHFLFVQIPFIMLSNALITSEFMTSFIAGSGVSFSMRYCGNAPVAGFASRLARFASVLRRL